MPGLDSGHRVEGAVLEQHADPVHLSRGLRAGERRDEQQEAENDSQPCRRESNHHVCAVTPAQTPGIRRGRSAAVAWMPWFGVMAHSVRRR